MANNFNIDIFHRNLELLRSLAGLKKGEFAKMIGVANVYRKDLNTLGPKVVKGILNNFSGLDEDWLSIEHPEGIEGINFTPRKSANSGRARTGQGEMKTSPPAHGELSGFVLGRLAKEIDQQADRITQLSQRVEAQGKTIESLVARLDTAYAALIKTEEQKDFLPLRALSGGR